MRPRNALRAFLLLGIIISSQMGCIGLVPAREFMEDVRDPPELTEVINKTNLNHTFVTDLLPSNFLTSISYTSQERFTVDDNVNEIKLYIAAAFAGPDNIPGIDNLEYRYVKATLTDANGQEIWSENCVETCRPPVATFQEPLAKGTWTLAIEARGYGDAIANTGKDSFDIYIHLHRECWLYPNEDICSYD